MDHFLQALESMENPCDHREDPGEWRNLGSDPLHADQRVKIAMQLKAFRIPK